MKRWMRFRLRTLLLLIAFVAAVLGTWPHTYNCYKWSRVEPWIKDRLARATFEKDKKNRYSIPFPGLPVSSPKHFTISNCPAVTVADAGGIIHWDEHLLRNNAYYLLPPGEWVGSKEEAVQVWKREYLKEHGWRWW